MFKPKVANILRSLQNRRSFPTLVTTVISAGHQTTSLISLLRTNLDLSRRYRIDALLSAADRLDLADSRTTAY